MGSRETGEGDQGTGQKVLKDISFKQLYIGSIIHNQFIISNVSDELRHNPICQVFSLHLQKVKKE